MVTAKLPFAADSDCAVRDKVLTVNVQIPFTVSIGLKAMICLFCWYPIIAYLDCEKLIRRLLVYTPSSRISLEK